MKKGKVAKVYHAELWGLRSAKGEWLSGHHIHCTDWRRIRPKRPFNLFVPRDEAALEGYQNFVSVTDIFPVHSVGIVTARDRLTIHWSADEAWNTVVAFSRMDPELARQGYKLGKDAQDWKVVTAQKDLLDSGPDRRRVVPVLYRPFDIRYTYYTGRSQGFLCRPRPQVMRHMLAGENLALITPRRVEHAGGWHHAFVCERVSEHVAVSRKTIDYHFPLYEYHDEDPKDLFSLHQVWKRRANLNPELVKALKEAYGRKPTTEQIFHYVYALLYTDSYREKYAEFLRIDFPRIPFTADRSLFREIAKLGQRLVALHLRKPSEVYPPSARYEGRGDNRVAKTKSQGFRYDPAQQRVWINSINYFALVPLDVWEYQIGGYQVCEKWLKDRKDRCLILGDIKAYCYIVTALKRTIALQEEIDALYPRIEEKLLDMAHQS